MTPSLSKYKVSVSRILVIQNIIGGGGGDKGALFIGHRAQKELSVSYDNFNINPTNLHRVTI